MPSALLPWQMGKLRQHEVKWLLRGFTSSRPGCASAQVQSGSNCAADGTLAGGSCPRLTLVMVSGHKAGSLWQRGGRLMLCDWHRNIIGCWAAFLTSTSQCQQHPFPVWQTEVSPDIARMSPGRGCHQAWDSSWLRDVSQPLRSHLLLRTGSHTVESVFSCLGNNI